MSVHRVAVVQAGSAVFDTPRTLDKLAALTADSDVELGAVAVRQSTPTAQPRLLTFEATDLAVELEVEAVGDVRRLQGQLIPAGPGRIEVRQPDERSPRVVEVDARGWFVVERVAAGPVSLTCSRPGHRSVSTAWTRV